MSERNILEKRVRRVWNCKSIFIKNIPTVENLVVGKKGGWTPYVRIMHHTFTEWDALTLELRIELLLNETLYVRITHRTFRSNRSENRINYYGIWNFYSSWQNWKLNLFIELDAFKNDELLQEIYLKPSHLSRKVHFLQTGF